MQSTLIKLIATGVVATAAVLAGSASPASAFSTPGTGSPGEVSFATNVSAQHFFPSMPSMVFGGTNVSRSPASTGSQVVTVTYGIWSLVNRQWALSRLNSRSVTLATGQYGTQYGTFSALKFSTLTHYTGYRAVITVEWKTPLGTVLGTRTIDYNGLADYRCLTNESFVKCTVYDNRDGFGAFVAFS